MRRGKDVDIARDGTDEVEESCDGGTVPVPMFMQHCHATYKIERRDNKLLPSTSPCFSWGLGGEFCLF